MGGDSRSPGPRSRVAASAENRGETFRTGARPLSSSALALWPFDSIEVVTTKPEISAATVGNPPSIAGSSAVTAALPRRGPNGRSEWSGARNDASWLGFKEWMVGRLVGYIHSPHHHPTIPSLGNGLVGRGGSTIPPDHPTIRGTARLLRLLRPWLRIFRVPRRARRAIGSTKPTLPDPVDHPVGPRPCDGCPPGRQNAR